jgi:hypothetical protein
MESLELDSFGLSIVPSSLVIQLENKSCCAYTPAEYIILLLSQYTTYFFLNAKYTTYFPLQVSTYCLFVEDVLDIVSDTIVVHEDAVSRVQRLTQVCILIDADKPRICSW